MENIEKSKDTILIATIIITILIVVLLSFTITLIPLDWKIIGPIIGITSSLVLLFISLYLLTKSVFDNSHSELKYVVLISFIVLLVSIIISFVIFFNYRNISVNYLHASMLSFLSLIIILIAIPSTIYYLKLTL